MSETPTPPETPSSKATTQPLPGMSPAPSEHILQFFAYAHLRPELQIVSRPFGELADHIVKTLPRNPERTKALDRLLEAKDAAVRALAAKP